MNYIVSFIDGVCLAVQGRDSQEAQENAIDIMETAGRIHDSIKSIRRIPEVFLNN